MVTKEQLEEYQRLYNLGTPQIDDSEYDALLEEYLSANKDAHRPFLRNKQSSAVNDIVGTLPKTYQVYTPMREGQQTYQDWVTKMESNGKVKKDQLICLQHKYDGCSVAMDCSTKKFFTRGDYDNGESIDVTDLFYDHFEIEDEFIEEEPQIVSIKFEAIMPEELFIETGLNQKYANARAATAAIISSRDKKYIDCVHLIPLRYYYEDGSMSIDGLVTETSLVVHYNKLDLINNFISDILEDGAKVIIDTEDYHYAVDGVVVSFVEDDEFHQTLSEPFTEVAIKILNKVETTKLIDIKWQFGVTGRITPVAVVEPVKFDNITVTNVGLSTFDRVMNLGLKYGDTVHVMHNITPYLLDSYHDGTDPIPLPTKCPECGADLNLGILRQVYCTNPKCRGRILGDMIRYAEKMKMYGVSKGILTKLFDAGFISDLTSLYELDASQVASLDKMGEKSADNIISSIKKASMNVPLERWLGALPCRDISVKTWKILILDNFNYIQEANAYIRESCEQETPEMFLRMLHYANGIGSATIRSMNEGIRMHWDDIHSLINYVTFAEPEMEKKVKGVVAMSGTRDKQLTLELERSGYQVDDFNSKCVALIVPNKDFTSAKVEKAKSLNIPIYTIEEAYQNLVLPF